jgi:probable rRNA maturation factor
MTARSVHPRAGNLQVTLSQRARPQRRGVTLQDIRRALALAAVEAHGQVNVALVDDAEISQLNRRYLRKTGATDVLSFDLRDDPATAELDGEVVVSVETAKRQARELGVPEVQEVLRYVVHGVLHLLGYDDQTPADRRRMRREEDRVLAAMSTETEPRSRKKEQRSPNGV